MALVGTPIDLSTLTGTQTVSVPTGAQVAVLTFSYWNPTAAATLSVTSDFSGAFTMHQVSNAPGTPYSPGGGFGHAKVTSTGAGKSITMTYSQAPVTGPNAILTFWDGVNADDYFLDASVINDGFATSLSRTVNSMTGGQVLKWEVQSDYSTPPPAESGYTQAATAPYQPGSRLSTADTVGASTTTATMTGTASAGSRFIVLGLLSFKSAAPSDTEPPTLTSASASATSGTTSSGSVTTNEANGTLYWLTNTSSTATATAVKAGSSQAVTATGVQSTSSTGLSTGTTYYTHFLHRDAAGNDSTVLSSASFTTPAPDTTAPTFTGSITVGAKTSSTIAMTLPTATDNVAVTGYQYRIDGGAWVDNGNSTAVSITGLTALTSYTIEARAYDAASNYSTTLSVTTSTYRAGASAGSIVTATGPQDGNPAGVLYALAQTLPVSDWVSYYTVSGPTPTGGTLDAQVNGAFSYVGPEPATWVIQPEVNGVEVEQITVTLYDQTVGVPTVASKQGLSMRNGLGL